ncbi:MAG: sigma-70 family RNA polymerase sigma factor [Lewinella sp.]|jgi:RNA polymerase sigma-70 factor (ECF subfamily)|uniref:sigma-70 family RNA polymerase sigma factor n=1 Tax=Lewinella sp. TaxID=2004506 RepID=UPI003D6C2439
MNKNYQSEYLQVEDELKSFVFRLVTNQQDTEDIIQDTYLKVDKNIDSFKEESSFKTWVFSIAINTAKKHLKEGQR